MVEMMKSITSSVISVDELKTVAKRKDSKITEKDGWVEISDDIFELAFKPLGPKFKVKIHAVEDPSDSDEAVTDAPIKFISKFLGDSIPGGEHWEKMSSSPDQFAKMVRSAADLIEEKADRQHAIRMVRRISAITCVGASSASKESEKGISDLERDMKKKGWKVDITKDKDMKLPILKVDINGIYEADITVDSLTYQYELNAIGYPELKKEGKTDEPVKTMENYMKSKEVFEKVFNDDEEESSEYLADSDVVSVHGDTMPAPKDKNVEYIDSEGNKRKMPMPHSDTVPAPAKKSVEKTMRSPRDEKNIKTTPVQRHAPLKKTMRSN
jgi:hypothetical protein